MTSVGLFNIRCDGDCLHVLVHASQDHDGVGTELRGVGITFTGMAAECGLLGCSWQGPGMGTY